jgi:Protein of unknown function (DUF1580)
MTKRSPKLIALADVPKLLPRPVHVGSVQRWARRGIDGRKLRSIRIGGRAFTTAKCVSDFLRAINRGRPVTL